MLIKLRQSEIEEGLKMYVAAQGINLSGKSVEIAFTASRGNDGLTADLDILQSAEGSIGVGVGVGTHKHSLHMGEVVGSAQTATLQLQTAVEVVVPVVEQEHVAVHEADTQPDAQEAEAMPDEESVNKASLFS